MTNKRVSSQNIVEAPPIVLADTNPDLMFFNPKNIIITKGGEVTYTNFLSTAPSYSSSSYFNSVVGAVIVPVGAVVGVQAKDVPDIGDIEQVGLPELYYDANKVEKYKIVIKVRNSSLNPKNVTGVDARIYDPNASI